MGSLRTVSRTLLHLLRSTHPGPSVAVSAVAVILGVGLGLPPERLLLLGAAILLGQFSIGLSNDWLDAERDRRSRRSDKPVALGLVSPRTAAIAALVSLGGGLVLTTALSLPALIAHAVTLAAAWGYNLGLKRTLWSAATYLIGFGALPQIVTMSREPPFGAPWWMIAAAAFLGLAAHFANVLPDLEADRDTGVRGLPHRFAPRTSGVIIFTALALAAILAVFGQGLPSTSFAVGALIAALGVAVFGIALAWTRRPTRLLFQLVILDAVIVVVGLAVSLSQTGG